MLAGMDPEFTLSTMGVTTKKIRPPKIARPSGVTRVALTNPEVDVGLERETGKHPSSRGRRPQRIQVWLDRCKLLGLETRQIAWDLHVVQGYSKTDTAHLLGVTTQRVWQIIEDAKAECARLAPASPDDFAARREEMHARLLSIYEEACRRPQIKTVDAESGAEVIEELDLAPNPQLLMVRLKCLDQMAKLHGLNMEQSLGAGGGPRYDTPEQVAATVRRLGLDRHGTAGDVEAIAKVFKADAGESNAAGEPKSLVVTTS